MKRRVAVAGVLMLAAACMSQGAMAQTTTPITYVGGGFFTTITSSCSLVGFTQNQGFTVVYRPGSNGQGAGLQLQFQVGSALLSTSGTTFTGKQSFSSIGITDKALPYSSNGTSSLVIKTASDSLSVTIVGTITDLYGDSSCKLTMRAAATQRP